MVTENTPTPAQAAQAAQAEAATPNDGDAAPDLQRALDKLVELEEQRATRLDAALTRLGNGAPGTSDEPSTPSKRTSDASPNIRVADRFDMLNYKRADFEMAMMLFDAVGKHIDRPTGIEAPEDLKRAWHAHVFESEGPRPAVVDPRTGKFSRAMDTAESGFGQQLVGQEYVNELWQATRNEDSIVNRVRQLPMQFATTFVPVDGEIPKMHFVGESTTENATNYTTSKTPSNRRQLDAKKFTIQSIWSQELDEDSLIAFTPFLREQIQRSAALHLGSAMYNGDTTNAGTGNINSDDGDPGDTEHYLAFDGIRHVWLVDATGQGFNQNGALDPSEVVRARGRLNAAGNDPDAIGSINFGKNPRDLVLVCDFDTYMALLDAGEVVTVDKYGPQATIVTGELGSYQGIPIVIPPYAFKTEADGFCSTTPSSNTKGQLTVFNPAGFVLGVRRDVQLFADRIQRTDQLLIELYLRVGFQRWNSTNVAAGIRNITV